MKVVGTQSTRLLRMNSSKRVVCYSLNFIESERRRSDLPSYADTVTRSMLCSDGVLDTERAHRARARGSRSMCAWLSARLGCFMPRALSPGPRSRVLTKKEPTCQPIQHVMAP